LEISRTGTIEKADAAKKADRWNLQAGDIHAPDSHAAGDKRNANEARIVFVPSFAHRHSLPTSLLCIAYEEHMQPKHRDVSTCPGNSIREAVESAADGIDRPFERKTDTAYNPCSCVFLELWALARASALVAAECVPYTYFVVGRASALG
jgi:hypothetical protein